MKNKLPLWPAVVMILVGMVMGLMWKTNIADAGPSILGAFIHFYDASGEQQVVVDGTSLPVKLDEESYPVLGLDSSLSCNTLSGRVGPLDAASYVVGCGSVKANIDQGTSTVEATTSERILAAGYQQPFKVTGVSDTYLAITCTSATICVVSSDSY